MRIKKIKLTWLEILYCICFFVHLSVYTRYITATYGYMGYVDDLVVSNIPLALIAIVVCSFAAGANAETSTKFFLHLALGTVVVPSMVLYCGSNLPFEFYLATLLSFLLVAFVSRRVKVPSISFFEIKNSKLLRILATFSLVSIASIFLLGGARFLNFDFSAVYDIRRDAAENLPGIFGYINSAISKVVIPFGMVLALLARKWIYVVLLFLCAILLFGLTAHKAVIFYPFVVIFAYYISGKERAVLYFVLALIFIGAISFAEFYLMQNTQHNFWFSSLLERRVLLTPSMLNWLYLDWFSKNEFYYWSDSKLSFGLVDPQYDLRSVNLIGLQYFGDEEMAANTGWIGSGYANAGLMGVFFYSVLIGLLLSLLRSFEKKLGIRLIVSLFFILILKITTSTDIVTSLLTHGLLMAIVLLSIMRPSINNRQEV